LNIKLSFIPERPEPVEDVRWTISIHNRGQAELVELEVLHEGESLRQSVNLLPGRYRRFTTFTYYTLPGEHQARFQVVVRTLSGAVHNYEARQAIKVHPPQPTEKLAGEVDLSGRIEVQTRPTVLAFADGASFSISVSGVEKEAAYQALKRDRPGRSALKLRITLYSALLYLLLKDHAVFLESVRIDCEYKGHEAAIKEQLINLFRQEGVELDPKAIVLERLTRKSPAYQLAKKVYQGGVDPERRVTRADILRLYYL
jgi:hypothetical protein